MVMAVDGAWNKSLAVEPLNSPLTPSCLKFVGKSSSCRAHEPRDLKNSVGHPLVVEGIGSRGALNLLIRKYAENSALLAA